MVFVLIIRLIFWLLVMDFIVVWIWVISLLCFLLEWCVWFCLKVCVFWVKVWCWVIMFFFSLVWLLFVFMDCSFFILVCRLVFICCSLLVWFLNLFFSVLEILVFCVICWNRLFMLMIVILLVVWVEVVSVKLRFVVNNYFFIINFLLFYLYWRV